MSFKALRIKSQLTPEKVANLLDIKVETYRKYECYVLTPGINILSKMPVVFNCTADEVFEAYHNAKEEHYKRYKKGGVKMAKLEILKKTQDLISALSDEDATRVFEKLKMEVANDTKSRSNTNSM